MKKFVLGFIAIICIALILLAAWLFFHQNDLKQQAIVAINKELITEVKVDGPIDISLFKQFPQVSLSIQEVSIADNLRVGSTMLSLEEVLVSFNLLAILRKEYTIQSISLIEGYVALFVDENGKENYNITKPVESDNSESLVVDLSSIQLQNIQLSYSNLKDNISIDSQIYSGKLGVQFEGKNFDLSTDANLFMKDLKIGKQTLLTQNEVNGKVYLSYNSINDCYQLTNNTLNINKNDFVIDGSYCNGTDIMNFTAKASGEQLENALALIPTNLLPLEGVKGSGNYRVNAKLTGNSKSPNVTVDFDLKDGVAEIPDIAIPISNLNVSGAYNNQNKKGDELLIEQFSFTSKESSLGGGLRFPNLAKGLMEMDKVSGNIDHATLNQLTSNKFEINEGDLSLESLSLHLSYRDTDSTWNVSQVDGQLTIDNFRGQIVELDKPFELNGNLQMTGNTLNAKGFQAKIAENDMQFTGSLQHFLDYLQKDRFGNTATMRINGALSSTYFNIDDFVKESNEKREKGKENPLDKWLNLAGNLQVDIAAFRYLDLELSDISMKIEPEPNSKVSCSNLKATGLKGNMEGNVQLHFTSEGDLEITIASKLNSIDIHELFKGFRDFDQEAITAANLKGKIDANLIFTATWLGMAELNEDDMIMQADLVLSDGELIELPSLEALSKHISMEQLEHLYFSELASTITIKDREINLPETRIASNLLSLSVSGTHTFDDVIDYSLKLNLKNLLAAKWKVAKTMDKEYVNDAEGGINVYVRMTGTVDDPKITYDKQSVKQKIKEDFKAEKEELKDLFKNNEPEPENSEDYMYFEEDSTEFINWE